MKEIAAAWTFSKTGQCNCGGGYTEIWSSPNHPQYQLKLRTATFTIEQRRGVMWHSTYHGNTDEMLQSKLHELFFQA
jgi:hypothetical protein